jgi:serine O-acetyltransferase
MAIRDQLNKALYLIRSDLYRYTGEISFKVFAATYIREPGFNFMVWLRIRTTFKSKIVGYILHTKRIKFGIDIQTFNIGEGFYIGHYGHIVVNGDAVIGKNCNISQGVTIGIANTGSKKGVPIVGDYVYIAPGAKIMGSIKIGNYSAIGANSVVVNDVPENAVVVGVPARVVSNEGSTGYINRVFESN